MKVNKGWVLRLAVAGFVLSGWRAAAAEYSWVGNGPDNKWTTSLNWQGGTGYPDAAGDVATFNAAGTVLLDMSGVLTIGRLQLTSSTPKTVRIEADPGAAFTFSGIAAPNSGFKVDGHADNRLVIAPDIVAPSRIDQAGAGTVEFEGAVSNTMTSGYALIFGAGSTLFSGNASLAVPSAIVGIGNGSPAVVTLTNQAVWSVNELQFGVASSGTTRGTLVQDSEDSEVTAGLVRLQYHNVGSPTNVFYRLRKGKLTAAEMIVG